VGKPFKVNGAQIKQWFAAMFDFVGVTDRYFARRCRCTKSPALTARKAKGNLP
jgi:hypothetical protein